MASSEDSQGLTSAVRRAVGGALDATVGRVGEKVTDTARDVTEVTARQIIEDLEPYLIAEAVPRIVEGLKPYLIGDVVPDVVDGVTAHLVASTVPQVVDGVTGHLVLVTVPAVIEGATPRMVNELLPRLLEELRPYLEAELVPKIVAALVPQIEDSVAPQLVDSLMPKIRTEVVPAVLDDIVDDPRVRELIREQSQGLVLDAIERVRSAVATADNAVETLGRRVLWHQRRPLPGPDDLQPPLGRKFPYAGLVSRGAAWALDLSVISWLVAQGLSALVNLANSLLDPAPQWLVAGLTAIAASLAPIYFGACWWLVGYTLGDALLGFRLTTGDGRRPRFIRAMARAWFGFFLIPVWVVGMAPSLFDRKRRGWLDNITGMECRYIVHKTQQDRLAYEARQRALEAAQLAAAPPQAERVTGV